MTRYGTFELVIGVPAEYDGHRCEYAREYVSEKYGVGLADNWVIQKVVPTDPIESEANKQYYEFGGNVIDDEA